MGLLCRIKAFNCFLVLLCTLFCLSGYGLCATHARPNLPEYDACVSSGKNCDLGFSDTVVGGGNLGSASTSIRNSFQNVCPDTHSFCVPLTIYGFNDEEKSLKAASLGVSGRQCDGPFCGLSQDSEVTSSVKDLLLSPNTVTHVGIIYCSNLRTDLYNLSPEVSNLQENCKLVIFTNDTTSPQVEIPCEDALHVCFEHQRLSFEEIKDKTKLVSSGSTRAEYVVRKMGLPPNVKVTETTDVDELVNGNWMSQGTTDAMSVLVDDEVLFPMVQVGSYVSRWITVKNPSHHPVTMKLILNTEEIIDDCRGLDDIFPNFSSGNLVIDEVISAAKYGFSVPGSAVTEAYVHPNDYATLGPIHFYPSKRCGWNGSALIKNNLTGVESIPLRGIGGLSSLALLERSEHVQSISFDLKLHNLLSFSLSYSLLHMKDMVSACSQPLVKEIYAKNTGDLPLEVKTMRVSGRECGLDGFKIHDCKGFALDPGESIKLQISYQTDFSAAKVHRDLELALASGIFLIPMKASVPYGVLCNCKKFMFWVRVKKWLLGFILVASLFFMVSLDYLCKNDNNSIHITLQHDAKTPLVPCSNQRKDKLSVSDKTPNMFCSVRKGPTSTMRATCVRYSYDLRKTSDQEISQHLTQDSENHKQTSLLFDTTKKGKSPTTAVQSSDAVKPSQETVKPSQEVVKPSQEGELKVKIGKEKTRRRKKKNSGAKLTAMSEVSSSRSGNSTPSPPSSPVAPASTKSSCPLSPDVKQPSIQPHSVKTPETARHPKNSQVSASAAKANTSKTRVPVKSVNNNISSPKVWHSPSTSDASTPFKMFGAPPMPSIPSPPSLVSTSSVSLSCRAPGSKLDKQATVSAPKNAELAEEYIYDIWGGHLSGIHLLDPKDVTCMKSCPAEKNFNSFFVGDPQAIK
ncbi:transmembrane protein 131-like [Trifolium pratense]|uniref:transmembrane protein 131-like n=1 Tax=Trifolium pratense TaxID=57577 RepID=UPI001E6904AF|nr:transmembrane protein 131-like [Trifolium pratense]